MQRGERGRGAQAERGEHGRSAVPGGATGRARVATAVPAGLLGAWRRGLVCPGRRRPPRSSPRAPADASSAAPVLVRRGVSLVCPSSVPFWGAWPLSTCCSAPSAATSPVCHSSTWQSSSRVLVPGRLCPLAAPKATAAWEKQSPELEDEAPRGHRTVFSVTVHRPPCVPSGGPCVLAMPVGCSQRSAHSRMSHRNQPSRELRTRTTRSRPSFELRGLGQRGSRCPSGPHGTLPGNWVLRVSQIVLFWKQNGNRNHLIHQQKHI